MATALCVPDAAKPGQRDALTEVSRTRMADSRSRGWRVFLVCGGLMALIVAFLPASSGVQWVPSPRVP
jgi:hypothetical protein